MPMRFIKFSLIAAVLAAATPAWAGTIANRDQLDAYSAVLGAGKYAYEVRHLRDVPSVGVVSLNNGNSAFGRDEVGDVQIAAESNGAAVDELRHALMANPVTRHALQANGIQVDDVLGVQVGASGSLRVFTN